MSIEAMNWAMTQVRIPESVDARQRPHLRFVLLCLAGQADSEGRNSFPTVSMLCAYTELSRSTVLRTLKHLEELELIRKGSQAVVEAFTDRADRIPNSYDLAMNGVSYEGERGVIRACTGCHKPLVAPEPAFAVHAHAGAVDIDRATISEKKEDVPTHIPGQGEVCTTEKISGSAAAEPVPAVRKRRRFAYSDDFEMAWAAYGRRGEKPEAYAEWVSALERESMDTIMAALVEYIDATEYNYRKHLQRWLKYDMWESAVSGPKKSKVEQIDEEMAKGDFRHVGNREYIQSKIDKMTHEEKIKYGVIRP